MVFFNKRRAYVEKDNKMGNFNVVFAVHIVILVSLVWITVLSIMAFVAFIKNIQ